jgi:Fuc2NAc and GlcNAc transferase
MIWPLITTALTSCAVTWLTLRVVRRWQVYDEPVGRSSHERPTPTLGGLGIIAGTWAGYALWQDQAAAIPIGSYGSIAATLVVLLFVLDDAGRPLAVWEKLLVQIAAAVAVCAGGLVLSGLTVPGLGHIELTGLWAWLVTGFWLMALMNIYNFMDGIDGIGSVQAVTAGSWFTVCLWAVGCPTWPAALVVVIATAAFLPFNFPPARIFMGDVGAMFLGLQFGILAVSGAAVGLPLWVFAAIFGYYLFDVSYTLLRRALRGENLVAAHRLHLYQRFVQRGWSQRRVNGGVALLNVVLGAGVYLLTGLGSIDGLASAKMAGVLLVALAMAVLLAAAITVEVDDRRAG